MKTFGIQLFLLVVSILAIMMFLFNQNFTQLFSGQQPTSGSKVKVKDVTINIEIADTKETRAKGLGGRDSIATDSGMLFVFDSADKHRFWMKDMKFPIDIIWINNGQVVNELSDIEPPAPGVQEADLPIYEPTAVADRALEVAAGFIKAHQININDKVEILN